ncbi:hypothetical protein RD149_19015 [Gordonia westfalica]|uniref:Uncharacterized protein n=1 Tax=Gordonia westfalica TaxID=158898 RepID=A0A1H2JN55_9ACTN|nr:hypothetical protein [Gordonia westfalica]MDS1115843.1 hypothetical protein [Gordonia westfalica]SDU57870.1 hypothetical protein SAMN04488548_1342316 [Gordonia westfalica]
MANKQGQTVASGAFQLFGSRRRDQVSELLGDIFGRTDIEALASDWRGVVYFTLAEDESIDPETVLGFDASSGSSGELATLDEVLDAVRTGEVAEAVDVASFDAWRTATGTRSLDMGACVPPALYEFLGGDPAERAVEAEDLVTFVATAAAIMGRLEKLGVEPGDEIPDEVFDEDYWK